MVGPRFSQRVCLSTLHKSAWCTAGLPTSLSLPAALPRPPAAVSGWLCAEGRGSPLPPPPSPHLSNDQGRDRGAAELRPGSLATAAAATATAAEEDPRGRRWLERRLRDGDGQPGGAAAAAAAGQGRAGPGRQRAAARPGIAGADRFGPPGRCAPPLHAQQAQAERWDAPAQPERRGIRAGAGARAGPELEPKLEPALRRTERSAAAKPSEWRGLSPQEVRAVPVGRLAPLFCSKDYMSFKRPCPLARYNRTSYFYPTTFSESSEHSHLLVSPVLVASAVIGVVITLSCITIIVGSIRRDRQARIQRHHHRHRRHHHHHRHRRHRHREYEQDHAPGGHTQGHSSHRMPYACSPAEDWPPPLDISSEGDVDVTVLRELYPDSPPGYEECVGPGATQLYVPTDAPPPYSMTDSCPILNGPLDSDSGHSHSHHQQDQRTQGQGGLHTVSMDTLPPYEAVCGTGSPSDLLLLPGPEPQLSNSQGLPTPTQALTPSPERIV